MKEELFLTLFHVIGNGDDDEQEMKGSWIFRSQLDLLLLASCMENIAFEYEGVQHVHEAIVV